MADQCNFILDCTFGPISDPAALAASSEHRIFIGLTSDLIVAGAGGMRHLSAL
jgi:ribose 5-phosphate isomerase A